MEALFDGGSPDLPEVDAKDIEELEKNPAWLALKLCVHRRMIIVAWYMLTHPERDCTGESHELRALQKLFEFNFSQYSGTAKPEEVKAYLDKFSKINKKEARK